VFNINEDGTQVSTVLDESQNIFIEHSYRYKVHNAPLYLRVLRRHTLNGSVLKYFYLLMLHMFCMTIGKYCRNEEGNKPSTDTYANCKLECLKLGHIIIIRRINIFADGSLM